MVLTAPVVDFPPGALDYAVAALADQGFLVVRGALGAQYNNEISARLDDAGNYVFTDTVVPFAHTAIPGAVLSNGDHTLTIPQSAVLNPVIYVLGGNGNDTLRIDASAGVPIPAGGLFYDGGAQTSETGDSLVLTGGDADTVDYTFINENDGSVSIDGRLISYVGLEPVTDNMSAANRSFTFTGATETISITDSGGADGLTRINSTLGELVDFAVPTASLTVITNGGDTVDITAFDAAFNTPLISLQGTTSTNTYRLTAANVIPDVSGLSLTGNVNFNLNGFSEQVALLASTDALPTVTLSAGQTLTVGNANNTTYSGLLTGPGNIAKVGTGTLQLNNGGNNYTGSTTISEGTIQLGANNALPATTALTIGTGTTVGALDMATFNQTVASLSSTNNAAGFNLINIGVGRTLTVNGNVILANNTDGAETNMSMIGGGSLVATGTNFFVGNNTTAATSKARLDLSALAAVNVTMSGAITVQADGDNGSGDFAILTLSNTANTLISPTLTVGASSTGSLNRMILGNGTNVIWTNTFNIGTGGRDAGSVTFGSAAGTVQVRNQTGTGAATFNMGTGTASTATGAANVFNTLGHNADLQFGAVTIGTQPRSTTWSATLSFDTGTLTMASLTLGTTTQTGESSNGAGTPRVSNATVNIGGGAVNITGGILKMGEVTGTAYTDAAKPHTVNATLNVSGGTVNVGATSGVSVTMSTLNITGTTNVAALASNATINISGGTLSFAGDIVRGPVGGTSTGAMTTSSIINQTGGTLSIKNVGTPAQLIATSFASGTLFVNGIVAGLAANVGAAIRPGTAPGPGAGLGVFLGNYVQTGLLAIEISHPSGIREGLEYDSLKVIAGSVTMNAGATLSVTYTGTPGTFTGNNGQLYTLIDNDGTSPADTIGTFAGMPEGTTIAVDGRAMRLSYVGGDGNDVVLTAVSGNPITTLYVDDDFPASGTVDGNLEATGTQTATMGTTAFQTVAAALAANPTYTGLIILNGGTYPTIALAGGTGIMLRLVQDLTNAEPDVTIQNLSGDANDTIVMRHHNVAGGNLTVEQGTFAGVIGGSGDFSKTTAGTLTFSGGNVYLGSTTITGGTLTLAAANTLPATTTVTLGTGTNTGTLDVNADQTISGLFVRSNTATFNTVDIAPSTTLLVNGTNALSIGVQAVGQITNVNFIGGGTLNVTNPSAGTTINFGLTNTDQNATESDVTVDMRALGNVILNVDNVRVSFNSRIGALVQLSNTANTINASVLSIGDSTSNNAGSPIRVELGTGNNVLQVNTLTLGAGKANATLQFASQAAGSPGTVSILGRAGGAATTNINIGVNTQTNTATTVTGNLDLRGHVATVQAGTITLARSNRASSASGATGNLLFDAGTFSVSTLNIAEKAGAATGNVTGNLTIGGGTFTVNAGGLFRLGLQADAASAIATVNLNGGTLIANVPITDGGGVTTSTLNLAGGTLNMMNNPIGTAALAIDAVNLQSGVLRDVSEINGGGANTKTTTGTLEILGTNGFTGATTVAAGTLKVNGLMATSATTVQTGATLSGTGTTGALTVNAGGTHTPGDPIGRTTVTGNYAENGALAIQIGSASGSVAGTDYDQVQIVANGSVAIGAASTLAVTYTGAAGTFAPGSNQVYIIIDNDGTAPGNTTGTFTGLPGGATVTVDGKAMTIQYNGGDGNDVVLIAPVAATPTTVYVDDAWTGFTVGQAIVDADLGTTGNQGAQFGVNAFSTVNAALSAVTASGTVIINGGTYAETVSVTGTRTVEVTGPDAAQAVTIEDLTTAAGTFLVLEGTSTLTFGDADSRTLDGVISGNGNLAKLGAGTATITGANTYAGATTVSAGTLEIRHNTALGTTAGGTVVASGATLQLNAPVGPGLAIGAEALTLNGSGVGGNGALRNLVGTSNTYAGNITLAEASEIQADNWLQLNANVNNGGFLLTFDGADTLTINGIISGAGGLTKNGTGALSLLGANTYDGVTNLVGAADVSVWQNTSLGSTVGGTVVTAASVSLRGGLTVAETFTINGAGPTFFGAIRGDGGAPSTVTGAITLGSASTIKGVTGSLTLAGTINNAGFPLTLDTNVPASTLTVSSAISGSGGLNVGFSVPLPGAGTIILTGTNTFTGNTAVNGRLVVNGSIATSPLTTIQSGGSLSGTGTTGPLTVNAGGTHTPGNPIGIETTAGNYVQNGGLVIQIATPAGLVVGTDYDQVKITSSGSVAIGAAATLAVNYTGAAGTFNPAAGGTYIIIDNDGTAPGDTTGTFAGLAAGATVTVDGKPLTIQYNGGDGNDVVLVAPVGTTLYVNDQFTAANGTVVDGDLETGGSQSATIGTTAFASIAAALAAQPGFNGDIIVNGGTYASALLAGGGNITLRLVQDLANTEPNVTLNDLSGAATDAIITRFYNVANANLTVTQGTFSGVISGAGTLTKTTAGLLDLIGLNTYTGATTVSGGNLRVTGSTATSATTVQTGATISGIGTTGPLTVNAGGTHSPGVTIGIETSAGNYVQNGSLTIEIATPAGLVAGTDYDQVKITGSGSVNISAAATLTINYTGAAGTFSPAVGNTYILIDNDGNNPADTVGTFAGLPPGATISVDGKPLQIQYNGGDGNDVVLVAQAVVAALYVNDQFTAASGTVVDGDFETAGSQNATIGTTAFVSIAAALAANPGYTGLIVVNGGTYASALLAGGGNVTLRLVQDLTNNEPNVTLNSLSGDAGDAIITRYNNVANANLIVEAGAFPGMISGSGNVIKNTAGTVTLSGANTYTGTTNVSAGTLQLQGGSAIADAAGAVSVGLGATLQLLTSETISSYVGAGDIGPGTNDSTLNLGALTLTTTGSAALGNVTTATGGTIVAGTTLTDADDDNNVTGPSIVLQAATGVGTLANPLETTVANLEASGGTGGVFLANAGDLIIGGIGAMVGVNATGTGINVSTAGLLTINENVAATGAGTSVTLSTIDAPSTGQNLILPVGVTVSSEASSVTLNAGDDATIAGSVTSGTTATVNVDATNADPLGGVFTLLGAITAPSGAFASGDTNDDTLRVNTTSGQTSPITLMGGAGNDTFVLQSATNTVDGIVAPIVIDGSDGLVANNNDQLVIVDTGDATTDNVLINAVSAGTSSDYRVEGITSTAGNDVVFRNIDTFTYTSTSASDTIDAQFVSTTPMHDLNVVTLNGWTGGDQFLLFTSDQIGGTSPTPTGGASGLAVINLNGDAPGNPNGVDGNDAFGQTPPGIVGTGAGNAGLVVPDTVRLIRPSASTAINVNGGQPTAPVGTSGDIIGDVLNLDITSLPSSAGLILATAAGVLASPGLQPLTYAQIEDLNVVSGGELLNLQMGDTLVRGTSSPDTIIFSQLNSSGTGANTRVRLGTLFVDFPMTGKTLTFAGDSNDFITHSNVTFPMESHGENGDDYIAGGTANDLLVGGLGSDQINASSGNNIVIGDQMLSGTSLPQDSVTGGDDVLSALGGNDVFYSGGGNDMVSPGPGNDYLYGGEGDDVLDGNLGDDRLYGGNGNDMLSGSAGHDLLSGGAGSDFLLGLDGNDVLIGGTGADSLDGGNGDDLLITGSLANELSSWTSSPNPTTFDPNLYSRPTDNDAALLALLSQWSSSNNRSSLTPITNDNAPDLALGYLGNDDFSAAPGEAQDFNLFGMGSDETF